MNLPCKSGQYEMPADLAASYRHLYPSADEQFARMRIWLESNAARRPASPKSAPRFVANWFKRVPRVVTQRSAIAESRLQTVAALVGSNRSQSNVIDMPAVAAAVGRADIPALPGALWDDEARRDVAGHGR
jgi:hypothetical protein